MSKSKPIFWGDPFPRMVEIVPEGASGNVRIEHFEVSEANSRSTTIRAIGRSRHEFVDAGKYVRLLIDNRIMMSDTRMERSTNMTVYHEARGSVLIAGIGLGMIVHAIAAKPEVTSVTVVEKSPDVIKLVAPTLPSKKVSVVEGDIFEWKTTKKFDTLYFDIWANISTDSLPDMAKLHRRFAHRKTSTEAWMGSWRRAFLLRQKRQEREEERVYDALRSAFRNRPSTTAG